MSYWWAKDGAMVSGPDVTEIRCTRCGVVKTYSVRLNERELRDAILEHVRSEHGGVHD